MLCENYPIATAENGAAMPPQSVRGDGAWSPQCAAECTVHVFCIFFAFNVACERQTFLLAHRL